MTNCRSLNNGNLSFAPKILRVLVKNGRARATIVKIGHWNNRAADIISGLSAGDQVILHPSDRVTDGVAVAPRESR